MAATSWGALLKSSVTSWNEDKALRLSAAIAYYAVFSIAPLLVIAMGIAGLVFGGEAATGQIYAGLKGYIGAQAADAVQAMVKSASKPAQGTAATITGFVMLMLGASGVLGQLKDALNTVWGVKPKPGLGAMVFIREKFLNFGMVLAIGFIMLASLVMSSLIAAFNSHFGKMLALPTQLWWAIGLLISMALTSVLLAMIFKYLPDARIRFRDVWLGAGLTALLLEVGKAGLGWYLGLESTASAYGTAGSVVLLLLWVYYTSCIVLFGAEFTRAHARASGHPIVPSARAEAVSPEERHEQGTEAKSDCAAAPAGESCAAPLRPMKKHRLMEPVLSYLEARMTLLNLEAKEALQQGVTLLVLALVVIISVFIIWMLATTALVGLLTNYLGGSWIQAVLWTAGLHALVVGISGTVLWLRFRGSTWFADTLHEFRKDRQWLSHKNPKT